MSGLARRGAGARGAAHHRGRGRGGRSAGDASSQAPWHYPSADGELLKRLQSLDGQGYGSYRSIVGTYTHQSPDFRLSIDHAQSDPFAPPSRVRAIIHQHHALFPAAYFQTPLRQTALCDYITRTAARVIRTKSYDQEQGSRGNWHAPKGGNFYINAPSQHVLPRSSCVVDNVNKTIELRLSANLPGAGRSILGRQAATMLCEWIPEIVASALLMQTQDQVKLEQHVRSLENQEALRAQLDAHELVAFVANGSVLPRKNGSSSLPMAGAEAVAFQSPQELETWLDRPHGGPICGMGIPKGVTLLTGGGFHGKSTLLEALQLGVYNVLPGDGRECVVTDPEAVKIRAEDGRSVANVNVSPFLANLPGGKDTLAFTADDASGSTSMAANIMEAIELGAKTLMIDEDTSATNFLVRDARMAALVKAEPITPLVSRVRALYQKQGISTIIVVGGLGDWLTVADNVIGMQDYLPRLWNRERQEVLARFPGADITQFDGFDVSSARNVSMPFSLAKPAIPRGREAISFRPRESASVQNAADAEEHILDLSGLEQLVETGQTRAIAKVLDDFADGHKNIADAPRKMARYLSEMCGFRQGDLVAVRALEIGAAVNRIRGLDAAFS